MNLLKVIHVSGSFFLLFTAFTTCANIVSEAYDQNNYGSLGFYTLATLYLTFAICSFLCSPLIDRLGARRSMQLGAFGYFLWVLAGLLPVTLGSSSTVHTFVWIIMILAGVVNGFGASILWVGQGKYVTDCSNDSNKGFHFGLFWGLAMLSQIVGSLIAAFLLKKFSQMIFFIIMSIFAFCGFLSFGFLVQPVKDNSDRESLLSHSSESDQNNHIVPLVDNENVNRTPDNRSESLSESGTPKVSMRSTLQLLRTKNMIKTVSLIIAVGMILAVYSGMLVKLISNTIEDKEQKLSKALYGMIFLGVGEVLGALVLGRVIDRFSNKVGVFCVMIVVIITISITVFTHSRQKYDVFWFITAFGWGLSDSTCNTSVNSICASQFKQTIEAFAISKFVHAIFPFIFLIAESYMRSPDQIQIQRWYIISVGIYGVLACLFTMTLDWKPLSKTSKSTTSAKSSSDTNSSLVE